MLTVIALTLLVVALVGAYGLGYSPKALWDAAVAKFQSWKANWK